MVAEKIANMPPHRPKKTTENSAVSQAEVAKQFKVSEDSIQQARKVRNDAIPEVVDAVESGMMPVSYGASLAKQ